MIYQLGNPELSLPDIRDIILVPSKSPDQYADLLDLNAMVYEIEDQLTGPSCVPNTELADCEGLAKRSGAVVDLSRRFAYSGTLASIGKLGQQQGLAPRDCLKFLSKYGVCLEDGPLGLPYDVDLLNTVPPPWAFVEAAKMKIKLYQAVIPPGSSMEPETRINQGRGSLNDGVPFGIALPVTESIYTLAGPWQTHQYHPVDVDHPAVGRHMMRIVGYDHHAQMFKVQNSWGSNWGDHGYMGLPYSALSTPFVEAWAVRNFNGWGVPEVPGIKLEKQNKLVVTTRITPKPEEIGAAVNVWMAIKMPNGAVFLRDAVGNWTPITGGNYPPTLTGFVLGEDNPVTVFHFGFWHQGAWFDLSKISGAKLFMAYGTEPLNLLDPPDNFTRGGLCTIPQY